MLPFAILAALLGLLEPYLLISFFVSLGRARIRFRFLNAILIAVLPIRSNINFVHISIIPTTALSPRSGRWRRGENIDINNNIAGLAGCYTTRT
jgi:hypothetical protein